MAPTLGFLLSPGPCLIPSPWTSLGAEGVQRGDTSSAGVGGQRAQRLSSEQRVRRAEWTPPCWLWTIELSQEGRPKEQGVSVCHPRASRLRYCQGYNPPPRTRTLTVHAPVCRWGPHEPTAHLTGQFPRVCSQQASGNAGLQDGATPAPLGAWIPGEQRSCVHPTACTPLFP